MSKFKIGDYVKYCTYTDGTPIEESDFLYNSVFKLTSKDKEGFWGHEVSDSNQTRNLIGSGKHLKYADEYQNRIIIKKLLGVKE